MSPVSPTYGPTSPRAYSPQRAFSPGSDAGPSARGKGRRSGPGRPRSSRASAAGSPPPAGRGRPRGSGSGRGRAGKAGTAGPSRAGSARPPAPRSGRSESAAPNEAESDTELEARGGEESLAPEGSVIPPGYEAQDGQEDEPDPEPEDQLLEEDEFSLQKSIDMERKQVMRLLMDAFTPDQYSRHEAYRRSRLSKGSVRKVRSRLLHACITPNDARSGGQPYACPIGAGQRAPSGRGYGQSVCRRDHRVSASSDARAWR